MGRYTTPTLVAGRYRSAANNLGDNEMENYYIIGAEAELDGVLAKRYYAVMPFTPTPPYLTDLATDMTYLKLNQFGKNGAVIAKSVNTRLDMLRLGQVELVTSLGIIVDQSNFSSSENQHRTSFGPDDPMRWSVSSSWQDEIASEREGD